MMPPFPFRPNPRQFPAAMDTRARFELITIPEACRRLGVSRRVIDPLVKSGELPCYEVGKWPRVSWTDVMTWLESKRLASREVSTGPHGGTQRWDPGAYGRDPA